MQQGCFLQPLQRHPIARGLVHRQDSSKPPLCSCRSGSSGVLGTLCPQRDKFYSTCHKRRGSYVPETFLFDWVSKQTSQLSRSQHQQPQHAAAQSKHNVDFTAAQAALGDSGSSSDGSSFGVSAKQLLQTAVHSLENFEPLTQTGSFEDDALESFEESGMHTGPMSTAHIVKANYEVRLCHLASALQRASPAWHAVGFDQCTGFALYVPWGPQVPSPGFIWVDHALLIGCWCRGSRISRIGLSRAGLCRSRARQGTGSFAVVVHCGAVSLL
jgi:hypothetical protein